MTGRVIYSSGGNYKVLIKNKVVFCKPIGKFRNENIKILVGDIVDVKINEDQKGKEEINTIYKLYERKNEFIRPNISNIDYAIIVTSLVEPKLNDYYLDKLITIFNYKNVEPIIIFTKKDLAIESEYLDIVKDYIDLKFKVLIIDNKLNSNIKNQLNEWTKNKLSVVTGQTGVGKSTFLNNLNSSFNLNTGEISKSLGRGKHTTRHSEAFEIFENSYIVDTPGFSSLDIIDMDKLDISKNFLNFKQNANKCKFTNCLHLSELNCKIKEIGYSNRIMSNYKKLLEEV